MKTQLLAILLIVQGFIGSISYAATPVVVNIGNQTTTLCANQDYYDILDNLIIGHDTMTTLTFVNATSSNTAVINPSNISPYISNDNYTQSNVYCQTEIGNVGSQTTVTVHYFFTDGTNQVDVPVVYTIKPAPTVVFVNSNFTVCSSVGSVDLSGWVYPTGGNYGTGSPGDGNPLPGSILDVSSYDYDGSEQVYYQYTASNGCSSYASANVDIYAAPQVNLTESDASACGQNDGGLDASVYYNQTSWNYSLVWNDGNTTETDRTNLAPGSYHIDVTDEHGCIAEATASVGLSSASISANIGAITCIGADDGTIDLTVNGMTGPLTYLWSSGQTSQNITNVGTGTYTVHVSDPSGCTISHSYSLSQAVGIYNYASNTPPSTCTSSDGSISVNTSGSGGFTYLWSDGSTNSTLSPVASGIYTLTTTDQNGCSIVEVYTLNDYDAPYVYVDDIISSACAGNTGSIDLDTSGIGEPITFTWADGALTLDRTDLAPNTYYIQVSDLQGCDSYDYYEVGTTAPALQPLCMISVDSATTTNIVVWEKTDAENVSYYNIYRETINQNEFVVIDTVQNTNLSIFNDVMASPIAQSWRYRISAVDACGVEGPLSSAHKTMHITTLDLGNGDFQAVWNPYYGVEYDQFILYRYTGLTGWVQIATLPSVITSYYDTPPNTVDLDYMVELDLNFTCTADYEKAQDFNTTRSNKDKGNFIAGQGTGDSNNELGEETITMNVYPNPVSSSLTVEISDNGMNKIMYLVTVDGQIIKTTTMHSALETIDMSDLSNGLYFLKIEGQNKTIPVVKN